MLLSWYSAEGLQRSMIGFRSLRNMGPRDRHKWNRRVCIILPHTIFRNKRSNVYPIGWLAGGHSDLGGVGEQWYWFIFKHLYLVQFSHSVVSDSWDPMTCSMPGLPVQRQHPESTQTHAHWVDDFIQPSCPLLSPSPPAPKLSQHQGLFKWVSSSHQVAKVL